MSLLFLKHLNCRSTSQIKLLLNIPQYQVSLHYLNFSTCKSDTVKIGNYLTLNLCFDQFKVWGFFLKKTGMFGNLKFFLWCKNLDNLESAPCGPNNVKF